MAGAPQAYAAKPSQLPNPVPGADQQSALDAFMAQQKPPAAAASASPEQGSALDSFMAQQGGASAPAPQPDQKEGGTSIGDVLMARPNQPGADGRVQGALTSYDPNAGPIQQISDGLHQLHDLFTLPREKMVQKIRENIAKGDAPAATSWLSATILNNTLAMPDQARNFQTASLVNEGASPKEKLGILEKQVGKDNVKVGSDGSLNFRYPGEKEFRPLAPPGFEILNDTLGNTRQMGKEAVMLPAEAIAAWASGGNPYVITATRAAMQAPANYAMDKVSELDAGAVHDPERSRLVENLIDTGVEAGAGIILHKIAQAVPGTTAYEKLQARKQLNEVNLLQQSKDLLADAQHLDNSGVFQKVPGAIVGPDLADQQITFRADQIFPNDAATLRKTAQVKDSPAFQNVQQAQVENVVNAAQNMFAKISGYTGNDAHAAAEGLSSVVQGLDQAEGKAIGAYRAKAMAQLGNNKLPVPQQLNQTAGQMLQQLGFTIRTTSDGGLRYLPPDDLKPLMGKLGITKMGDMRSFVNSLTDYANSAGTGLRISEIDRLVNTTGSLNVAANRNGGQIAGMWGQFTSGLRQFRRDAIGAGLVDDIDVRGFNAAMDKFSAMREASGNLQRVLDGDFTSNAIAQQVFSKGQNGLSNLRAIKTLVKDDAPETWAALKQSWVDDMFRRYSTPGSQVPFNFAGMQKELGSYGNSFLDEAFDGTGVTRKDVQSLMNIAQNIQTTYKKAGAPVGMDEKAKQGIFNSLVGALGGMHFKVVNGLQQALGVNIPGNPMKDVLDPRELANRLAHYNGPGDKSMIEQNVKKIIATSRAGAILPQALSQANYAIRNVVKNAAKKKVAPSTPIAPEDESE